MRALALSSTESGGQSQQLVPPLIIAGRDTEQQPVKWQCRHDHLLYFDEALQGLRYPDDDEHGIKSWIQASGGLGTTEMQGEGMLVNI